MPSNNRRWLTVAEAADYLGITDRQVRRWVQQGRMPHTKMGLRLQFSIEQLDAFVDSCSRSGGT